MQLSSQDSSSRLTTVFSRAMASSLLSDLSWMMARTGSIRSRRQPRCSFISFRAVPLALMYMCLPSSVLTEVLPPPPSTSAGSLPAMFEIRIKSANALSIAEIPHKTQNVHPTKWSLLPQSAPSVHAEGFVQTKPIGRFVALSRPGNWLRFAKSASLDTSHFTLGTPANWLRFARRPSAGRSPFGVPRLRGLEAA